MPRDYNGTHMILLRDKAALLYQRATRIPVKALIIFGLFLVAAVFLAIHTALTAKDASLHLKLQHDFRNAQVSVWVDDDLAYAGQSPALQKRNSV